VKFTTRIFRISSILACLILIYSQAILASNFEGILPANNIAESQLYLSARKERVISAYLSRPLPDFSKDSSGTFGNIALARLMADYAVDELRQAILSPQTKPYAKVGTDITILPGLCERHGDYDFMLQYLVRLAYLSRSQNNTRLGEMAYKKLIFYLLNTNGSHHYSTFSLGLCGVHKDTENHILMTETSRYLSNQLLYERPEIPDAKRKEYDNELNGSNKWMLKHLQNFFLNYFEEYNSKPYQGYTVLAISNLYKNAWNPQVKLKAQMLLDLLSAVFAVQSNRLRRLVPFRRQPKFEPMTRPVLADAETARHTYLAGSFHYLKAQPIPWQVPYGDHLMLGAIINDYKVPDLILDLIIGGNNKSYFQKIRHDTVEIYYARPEFTLSAGGYYTNHFDMATKEQDGWARPTAIIPSEDLSADYANWIRFTGHNNRLKRKNTCLYKNFACGLGMQIPESIPENCQEAYGHWTFFNFNSPTCPLKYGFYVATWKQECKSLACMFKGDNFGFLEVRAANEIGYENFKNSIWVANQARQFKFNKIAHFKNSYGEEIKFKFREKKDKWEIYSADDEKFEREFKKWPFFSGDVLNEIGPGLIEIKNEGRGDTLTLDVRDPLNPKRIFSHPSGN